MLQDTTNGRGRNRSCAARSRSPEQSFGPEHPKVATGLNNLAQLLQDTNHLAEAEPLLRRALKLDEQSFGLIIPVA
ncbi:MAG: tetratricopeptide repeat protein [Acidobacteriota bacterium]